MNKDIKITERGWHGHYILASLCNFSRNTLIEYKNKKIIVSTVGNKRDKETGEIDMTAIGTYYETMCFYSINDEYDDIDASSEIYINGKCRIYTKEFNSIEHPDIVANDMHENVVAEIVGRLEMNKL